jgi:hypothetical protein
VAGDGIKIDKHPRPQEVVNLVLKRCIATHQPLKGGRFIGRIVIDVEIGVLAEARHHQVDELLEGGFFCLPRKCPIGGVGRLTAFDVKRIAEEKL